MSTARSPNDAGAYFKALPLDIELNDEPSFNAHLAAGREHARAGSEIAVSLGDGRCRNLS
jgi:hypothetical protein